MNEQVKPYIIVSSNGEVLKLLQTNEKGYKKSIENNQIWAINQETGRLLPESLDGKISGFSEKSRWYEALVLQSEDSIHTHEKKSNGESEATDSCDSDIINNLFRVIEQRKAELPEGSYTTHLFSSGIAKIRKKTGEEAVELILAENKDETVYEAADLIYHMLVLLSALDITPGEVFTELQNRD